ncbi:MAG: enoyl-CoA hydratase/isomerase family protein [Planctomycetota bacterium]|jgi:methylglutaconyl-CoA hydratase
MAKQYQTIEVTRDDEVKRITMSRPKVHNAFNEVLIADLTDAFGEVAKEAETAGAPRVVVYTGGGKSFSAGADLKWMGKMVDYTFEENMADSMALAELMAMIYTCPVPTIARVNGAAIGGGVGLLSACDIAIASDQAVFSLSEVKLGIVPACIAPYVIGRIGQRAAREFFLTGERFSAQKALDIGLVNRVAPHAELDRAVAELTERLITSGPQALRMAKELIRSVPGMTLDEVKPFTAEMIAKLRISDEGQEGIHAFFEKRKPAWAQEWDKKNKK